MSGGRFEYNQYKIRMIAEDIEQEIINSGRKKTPEEIKNDYRDKDWFEKYPEDLNHYEYPPEIIEEFRNAVSALKIAEIYAQRVDWLLSGDDSDESFLKRLKDDLDKLENE